jgi:hypothetical protein
MTPEQSGYGDVTRLARRRLLDKFIDDGDLSLRDMELEPIREAVKILGGSCLHAEWRHDDPEMNQWYSFATGLSPRWGRVVAMLHVPAEIIDSPSANQYRQVQELLLMLINNIARRILLFSYDGQLESSSFRFLFRELRSIHKEAYVEFKPWRDVEVFSTALRDSRGFRGPSPSSKRSLLYEARKLLSLR